MQCTWEGCDKYASHDQVGSDRTIWAHLCEAHHQQLEQIHIQGESVKIFTGWVKAQGGAQSAAERMGPRPEKRES